MVGCSKAVYHPLLFLDISMDLKFIAGMCISMHLQLPGEVYIMLMQSYSIRKAALVALRQRTGQSSGQRTWCRCRATGALPSC
jgi:hypothetical protein